MADFDVTIIGAGPAGCVAGISLARRGHRVAIIEQHRFPRDKVCGECLSALGIEVLDRLGLKDKLTALRPIRLTHSELISPRGDIGSIDLPHPMWGLSRVTMDAALLDAARDSGVEVIQPARCESRDGGVVRNLMTNEVRTITATWYMNADGKPHGKAPADLGVKAHFENVEGPSDTIALFGLSGHYVGLAPIERGRWNLAMSVPANRVRGFSGDLDALFRQILAENVELERRMISARRSGGWLTCPLPRYPVASSWPPKVIPIGNAAAALEPIGGEGMGLAMRSAELAADAVDRALRADQDVQFPDLYRAYRQLWRWRSTTARGIAWLMSRPRCARMLVNVVQIGGSALRPALIPLGKS